jgi:ribosomal subunit interface protein
MQVQVSGRHVDVGEALRSRIVEELSAKMGRFFGRGGDAEVVVAREAHLFRVDCLLTLASGQQVVGHAFGGDAHAAFDGVLDRVEERLRRYKRRLKNHHASNGRSEETAPVTVIRAPPENEADDDFIAGESSHTGEPPAAMVIAETERPLRTMTVRTAVLELDLTNYPVILFRNAAHGGLSVVYRRPDGNIGWIDPERTRPEKGRESAA